MSPKVTTDSPSNTAPYQLIKGNDPVSMSPRNDEMIKGSRMEKHASKDYINIDSKSRLVLIFTCFIFKISYRSS